MAGRFTVRLVDADASLVENVLNSQGAIASMSIFHLPAQRAGEGSKVFVVTQRPPTVDEVVEMETTRMEMQNAVSAKLQALYGAPQSAPSEQEILDALNDEAESLKAQEQVETLSEGGTPSGFRVVTGESEGTQS